MDRNSGTAFLIKSEGIKAVRALHKKFPNKVIVADMKTIEGGSAEIEIAAKPGANRYGLVQKNTH